jgi:ATP adenylyltransferase
LCWRDSFSQTIIDSREDIDSMEIISAAWREAYIKGEQKQGGCVLCRDSVREEGLVVYEGKNAYVMVNRYPYTGGHLMVVPFRHVSILKDISGDERMELFWLVDISVQVLTEAMQPDGLNIGMNIGKSAGAGIESHLHIHVVPRWSGDTNFITVIGDVRVIPSDVFTTARELRPYFSRFGREADR